MARSIKTGGLGYRWTEQKMRSYLKNREKGWRYVSSGRALA
jgi:hypothetical protein